MLFKILDIVNQVKPDERCVMAYVSSYYHAFSGAQQVNIINIMLILLTKRLIFYVNFEFLVNMMS